MADRETQTDGWRDKDRLCTIYYLPLYLQTVSPEEGDQSVV